MCSNYVAAHVQIALSADLAKNQIRALFQPSASRRLHCHTLSNSILQIIPSMRKRSVAREEVQKEMLMRVGFEPTPFRTSDFRNTR